MRQIALGTLYGMLAVLAIFATLPPVLKLFFWWMGVWFPSPY